METIDFFGQYPSESKNKTNKEQMSTKLSNVHYISKFVYIKRTTEVILYQFILLYYFFLMPTFTFCLAQEKDD